MQAKNEEWYKNEIRQHINNNQLLSAVKCIRELSGLGLKESKDLYDQFKDYPESLDEYSFGNGGRWAEPESEQKPNSSDIRDDVLNEAKRISKGGNKIGAIKYVKDNLNIGLKEAKDIVDNFYYGVSENTEIYAETETESVSIESDDPFIAIESELDELEEPDVEIAENTIDIKQNKEKSENKEANVIFGRVAEREKLNRRKRSNSGCMLSFVFLAFVLVGGVVVFARFVF